MFISRIAGHRWVGLAPALVVLMMLPAWAPLGSGIASRGSFSAFQPGGTFQGTGIVGSINYSSNWSGYAVTGGTFKTVTLSWTQDSISCTSSSTETDMSPWVGIDGYSSKTVEQTGSSGDCNGLTPDYYAWYEMFPKDPVIINEPVQPDDQFTATVTHTVGTDYTLTLEDITQGWTNKVTKSITAKDDSAEAVMEMAAKHLTQFDTDPFTSFTVDGKPMGSYKKSPYKIHQMEIKVGSTVCDSTSPLSNRDNFTVTWLNAC
jgi:hypothetical protein